MYSFTAKLSVPTFDYHVSFNKIIQSKEVVFAIYKDENYWKLTKETLFGRKRPAKFFNECTH